MLARPAGPQHERAERERDRARQQQPARGGERVVLEDPLPAAEQRDRAGDRRHQQADRRPSPQPGVQRHRARDDRHPCQLSGRVAVAELGPEHVGEPQQRRVEQQQAGDEQHRLIGRRAAALVRRLQPEREHQDRRDAEREQVERGGELVDIDPQLPEREAGGEDHGPGGDQRTPVGRRAQQLGEHGRNATERGLRSAPLAHARPTRPAATRPGRGSARRRVGRTRCRAGGR